ncbi:MAG: leucine-rich repeat domain-containing protein, partial [Clostridia bacterium]|nr:leucine-rich repeat domain-containing protein [Clostridia bacterium]
AFYRCNDLVSIDIPENVKTIGASAFFDCKQLSAVRFSEGLKKIGHSAFYYCEKIKALNIPMSVTDIDGGAFGHIHSASVVMSRRFDIKLDDIFSLSSDGKLPEGFKLTYVEDKDPFEIKDGIVVKCRNKYIRELTLPSSIIGIGERAFEGCERLSVVSIPASVKSIGSYAFANCPEIHEIFIPETVTSVGKLIFDGSFGKIAKLTLPITYRSIVFEIGAQRKPRVGIRLRTVTLSLTLPMAVPRKRLIFQETISSAVRTRI